MSDEQYVGEGVRERLFAAKEPAPPACGKFVYWWDGEYEGNCELPSGHDGPHFDGLSWFNDDNEMVEEPDAKDRAAHPE
jgi:hypothetical protein